MNNNLFLREFKVSLNNNGVETNIEHARIRFNITKSLIAKENTAYIDIFNLGKEMRSLIAQDNSTFSLQAGYKHGGSSQIILGDITDVSITRNATEVVTRIQVIEGYSKLQYIRLTLNFDNKPTLADILASITEQAKTPIQTVGIDTQKVFDQSYSDIGSIDTILNHLAMRVQFKWSLQNGELLLVRKRPNAHNATFVLNASSGLLLNPESVKLYSNIKPDHNVGNAKKQILTLMLPSLNINDIVAIKNDELQGNFRVTKITHNGDNRGNEWYSKIEVD